MLDSSLVDKDHFFNELDEKIMLGIRLKEGINIYSLFNEHNWEKQKCVINYGKLLKNGKYLLIVVC